MSTLEWWAVPWYEEFPLSLSTVHCLDPNTGQTAIRVVGGHEIFWMSVFPQQLVWLCEWLAQELNGGMGVTTSQQFD